MPNELLDHRRIALLTDGYSTPFLAKTAISILRYRTSDVACVIDSTGAATTAQALLGAGGDIPVVSNLGEVHDIDALYIGIAPPGGKLPEEWRTVVRQALMREMAVVSGLHDFITDDAEFVHLYREHGGSLIDVRKNSHKSTAKGVKFRPGCIRIHAVGHDCSVGKMVATVELERALKAKGHRAKFLATGQTGIMISGEGVPIDCVVSDFVNGAAEQLVQQNEDQDFLLIEGQGSIAHPAYSAVTLGLLHGSAPDGLIFCYEAGREMIKGFDDLKITPLKDQIHLFLAAANVRHPCQFIGMAINTRNLTPEAAKAEIARAEQDFGLPACDVYRDGSDKLVQASLQLRDEVLAK